MSLLPKSIRITAILIRFLYFLLIDYLLDNKTSLIILMLMGWFAVINLVFGHERQYSSSKIRSSSLTFNPDYSQRRVTIIVLPAFLIFFVLSLILFLFNSFLPEITFSLVFFINLIIYIDFNYSELSKNALINGNEYDLAIFTLIRFSILPLISILYSLFNFQQIDFFYFSSILLFFFVLYDIFNKIIILKKHFFLIFKSYIKMFIISYLRIISSIIPKLNNALLRNYLGLILEPQVALISIKIIIICSAAEILIDIIFWPTNYKKIMALNLRVKVLKELIFNYLMYNISFFFISSSLILFYYYYFDDNYFKNIDVFYIFTLILISFLISFESLISYISIRNNIYEKSQLINSLFIPSLFFSFFYLINYSLFFILLSLFSILMLRIKYAVFKNFN